VIVAILKLSENLAKYTLKYIEKPFTQFLDKKKIYFTFELDFCTTTVLSCFLYKHIKENQFRDEMHRDIQNKSMKINLYNINFWEATLEKYIFIINLY
jgi:hypothetical protein